MNTAPRDPGLPLGPLLGDGNDCLLLVEDNVFQAKMLEEMLRFEGSEVRVQHTESLAAARAALADGSGIACVVLDLTLPDSRGLEGVIDLCSSAPDTPLIVVTATDDEALAIEAVRLGAQDYLIKERIDSQLLRRSIRYAIQRKRSELLLAHRALHDSLTGLPNRIRLGERLHAELAISDRTESLVAVHFCDLNGFKGVNDTHGHPAGDRVLQVVARRLESAIRPADMVARYGGDEFTAVTGQLDGPARAIEIAERIRDAIEQPIALTDDEVHVSTSVGIALASGARHGADELIAAADKAMYRAKSIGAPHQLVRL